MPEIFNRVLTQAQRAGISKQKSIESLSWFRKKIAGDYKTVAGSEIVNSKTAKYADVVEIGKMYCFFYEAKTADTLPYWDKFPLIFPIGPAPKGFYGLNMHYLPPLLRAKLMDVLYGYRNNSHFDASTKLVLSYKTLAAASKAKAFQPCLKRYLNNQVASKFVEIESTEWPVALFLPMEQFQKASAEHVWNESRRKV